MASAFSGLGDQGANGMGIPVGKLSLYTACAGVHPAICLPITLDMGTNNETLLNDPYYVGLRRRRVTGAPYDELIEEFVTAARKVFPGVIIQFEDFANHNAFRLLNKYRDRICTFNDDIQGTAAVALAGILSALRIKGGALADQKLLFLGAGEAATGIADLDRGRDGQPRAWIRRRRARRSGWSIRKDWWSSRARICRRKSCHMRTSTSPSGDFLSAVKALKPSGIIGVAAVGGTFTQEVLRAMAEYNARPIVFALSNPTSKAECTAEQAYQWTDGRALFACGSPFRAGIGGRQDVRAAAGQQLVHLPRRRAGRDCMRRHAHHRRDVPRGSRYTGVAGHARRIWIKAAFIRRWPISARVGAHRGGRGRGRVPERVGGQAAAGEFARVR